MKTGWCSPVRAVCLLAVSGAILQVPGCAGTLLLEAIAFEVANLASSRAFLFTQVLVENFLDL